MENLEDFRKTGYTKNLFEAKVAKGSNQAQNNSSGYRKQSQKIEEEEDDEEIIQSEESIL